LDLDAVRWKAADPEQSGRFGKLAWGAQDPIAIGIEPAIDEQSLAFLLRIQNGFIKGNWSLCSAYGSPIELPKWMGECATPKALFVMKLQMKGSCFHRSHASVYSNFIEQNVIVDAALQGE